MSNKQIELADSQTEEKGNNLSQFSQDNSLQANELLPYPEVYLDSFQEDNFQQQQQEEQQQQQQQQVGINNFSWSLNQNRNELSEQVYIQSTENQSYIVHESELYKKDQQDQSQIPDNQYKTQSSAIQKQSKKIKKISQEGMKGQTKNMPRNFGNGISKQILSIHRNQILQDSFVQQSIKDIEEELEFLNRDKQINQNDINEVQQKKEWFTPEQIEKVIQLIEKLQQNITLKRKSSGKGKNQNQQDQNENNQQKQSNNDLLFQSLNIDNIILDKLKSYRTLWKISEKDSQDVKVIKTVFKQLCWTFFCHYSPMYIAKSNIKSPKIKLQHLKYVYKFLEGIQDPYQFYSIVPTQGQ